MSEENDQKAYDHYTGLIAGKVKTGNSVRDELIVSDATRHLKDLVKKSPNADFEKEEVKTVKSKGRK